MSFVESLEFSRLHEGGGSGGGTDAGLAKRRWWTTIVNRYGRTPEQLPVDTNYATSEDIAALTEHAAEL